MAGMTSTGFTKKTTTEIRDEIVAELLAEVDPTLDCAEDQPMGQIVAIVAQREAVMWELLETLCHAIDPDAAEGFLLAYLSAMTGTIREPARKSTISMTLDVDNNFTATAGQIMVNVSGQDSIRFVNAAAVGPLTPAGTYSVEFEATEYGAVAANAGTVTVITAPVSGLNSVTNAADAVLGAAQETDTSLRVRREEELAAPGASTVDSIRADVLQIDGVQQCFVFENTTLTTDADGVPGKAFEVVIYDGAGTDADDVEVAQAIWDAKPSGAETYGTTSAVATDSEGDPRTVYFSRAEIKNVYLEYTVTIDPTKYPASGDDAIKTAAVAKGESILNLGVDVIAMKMKSAAESVDGVIDVPTLKLGFSASPVGTSNLTITGRQIADLDTARITVTTAEGTP
jgi:uncharacterized phage protein gp47/JayE